MLLFRRLVTILFVSLCVWVQTTELYAQEQRVTAISTITVDGQNVPSTQWEQLILDTNSILNVTFLCREGVDVAKGVRFQVELDNGVGHEVKTQFENYKTYIGLPAGHHFLVVKAESSDSNWSAVPASLNFNVDASKAAEFRKVLRSLSQTPESEAWYRSPYVVYALIGLLVGASVLIVLLWLSRNAAHMQAAQIAQQMSKNPTPATNSVVVKDKKVEDFPAYQKILAEVERFKKDNAKLNKKVLDLSKKTEELNDQNMDLAGQVDRATNVKRELEDLQRQKDDLFAIIIHDIKNPASLVKNLVDLLRSYDLNSSDTQEVMEDIIETTTKIVSLSQELSRVMAMDQADIQLDMENMSPGVLIESVCRRNASSADKKGIAIKHNIPPNLPNCEIDPQKIEEVLDNLVSNAIKFSLPGTTITVRAVPTDDYLRLDVEDQGLGMSKEDTKRAFQRGMKLSARPTGDEPSSGLGLWIVKRLVEAHNGKVTVKSDIGMGTTFSVFLPYSVPSAHSSSSIH